jgi:SET domain-containing protein
MRSRFTPPRKIVVRRSKGKGRGVFATAAIARGELIEAAPVLLVPKAECETLAAGFLGNYMFQTDDGRHYVVALGLTAMVNHSPRANASYAVSFDAITIKARREIAPGTEITIDYGWRPEEWDKLGISWPE